jgi:hypothetical protein
MTDKKLYGVVIDCGKSREDRGVPAYFDGWYDTRAAADQAAIILQQRSPGAYVTW